MVNKLIALIGKQNVYENENLASHCTFGIGGNAKFLVKPRNFEECFKIIEIANNFKVKTKILGKGSNVLFSSAGYDGIIISTEKISSVCHIKDDKFIVASGLSLGELLNYVSGLGYSGLEFVAGIPGSVGGAVVMNAGANGSEFSDCISSVTYYENGTIETKPVGELLFGYRTSYFKNNPNAIVMFVTIDLIKDNPKNIYTKIGELVSKRKLSQPNLRSAGCVFKKCGDSPAGLLIDKCGLKGVKIGDAEVSNVHANFIVNNNNATSDDVLNLINVVQFVVKENFNKQLELEIEFIE